MFAIIAAILFGFALLFDLTGAHLGGIGILDLELAGLLFFALHFGWSRKGFRR